MGHVNPYLESLKKRESEGEREWEPPVPRTADRWASLLGVSVALQRRAVSMPNRAHFIFKCSNQACDPRGAFLQPGPWVNGSRWWFNSQGDGREKGKGWFSDWMSHKKAFFLSCLGFSLFTWLRHLFVPLKWLRTCQKIKSLRSFCGVVCYGAILPEHLVIHVSTGVFAVNYIVLVCMCRLVVMY